MSETTPEPIDTGDLAAVPDEEQLQEPDEDDHCEPTDLSDVTDEGDVVDLDAISEPEDVGTPNETEADQSTNAELPPDDQGGS